MMLKPKSWLCSSSRAASAPRLRLSAAHNEWNHVGIALAAMAEGFFADEGLTDVELISFEESTGDLLLEREAAQVDLLAQGIVDIAIDPRTAFVLEAKDRKEPVCIVAARRKNHAFVLMGGNGITTIHELRGKTIRMEHRGGATDVMMRQTLKDHGLEPDKDVPFSYSGGAMHDPTGLSRAFGEGRYGPAYLAIDIHVESLLQAGCSVLADLRKLYPSRHDRVTAANENFCKEHPEIVKGFAKAMIRGCRFVRDLSHAQRFTEIITEAGFLTSEREKRSFADLFSGWQGRVSLDLALPRDGIQLIVDEQKRDGKISGGLQVDDVLRLDMLERAQLELRAD